MNPYILGFLVGIVLALIFIFAPIAPAVCGALAGIVFVFLVTKIITN